MRIKMHVSIAGTLEGRDFGAQPGDVIDVPDGQAKKWISARHASQVPPTTPLSVHDVNLRDLSMEEALLRSCEHCQKRAEVVFKNRPMCMRHYAAEVEAM